MRARKDNYSLRKRCAQYRRRYGITAKQVDAILREQGGVCGICGSSKRVMVVDHSHDTGEIRGVLCRVCNTAIGFLQDDPQLLLRASEWCRVDGKNQSE